MSGNIDDLTHLDNTFSEKGEPSDRRCNEDQIDHRDFR